MGFKIKYVAQFCNSDTDEIIEQQEIKIKGLSFPKIFQEFGIRHKEQIKLIKNAQDFFIKFQCNFFSEQSSCPKCGKKTNKKSKFNSDFHDVFTDHKVTIQRLGCICGWQSHNSIQRIYGNASHPELVNLQVTNSAEKSFYKANKSLNDICCSKRKINNHVTLINNVNKVGSSLEGLKLSNDWSISDKKASEIILNIDGGHVQNREKNKRSVEELVATAYRSEDLIEVSSDKKEIKHKVSVASAMKDGQKIIKKLTKDACLQLGMTKATTIVALTDGASNCWSIVEHITKNCKKIIKILDWFYIGKKFKERKSKIPVELVEKYNSEKWKLWHGKPKDSLERLIKLKNNLIYETAIKKIDELIFYINNNKEYSVNYQQRQDKHLSFTNQLAESSINSIINERQKNKKMQWSRSGAHNLLQISTSIFSKRFDYDWNAVAGKMYKEAA
jgi:hypothetical protein